MAKRKKKPGWGGPREGAGRPPEIASGAGAEERVTVRVGAEHAQELDRLASQLRTTRAGALRWLIEQSARRAR